MSAATAPSHARNVSVTIVPSSHALRVRTECPSIPVEAPSAALAPDSDAPATARIRRKPLPLRAARGKTKRLLYEEVSSETEMGGSGDEHERVPTVRAARKGSSDTQTKECVRVITEWVLAKGERG